MKKRPTEYQMTEFAYHIEGINDVLHRMEAKIEIMSRRDLHLNTMDEQTKINKALLSVHKKIAGLEIDLRSL